MLPALLATIPLLLAQGSEPVPPTPFDRVLELEITEYDEPALENHGPTAVAEYEVEFNGTLHVWTTSNLDLFLRVDDAAEARPLASDEDSGGGTTPYLKLNVQQGDWLVILIAGKPKSTGPLTLHLIASPETEATRAAAAGLQAAMQEAERLTREGDQAAARDLLGTVITETADTAGGATSETLTGVRFDLADSMSDMGDLAGARVLWDSVVASYERILPAGHSDLLGSQHNLAISMSEMGDQAGARALRESVLAARERNLPADHPSLLAARLSLANSMYEMGDLAGARALYEAVVAARERILPVDHPDLLRVQNNLAISMSEMGDLAGARAIEESVLAGHERTLPADHPDLLRARAAVATSMWRMGDLAGARALREAVLAAYERSLPAGHPSVLAARGNLATSMFDMGDLAGARALLEAVLTGFLERRFPEGHPDILTSRGNLAVSMSAMGDFTGARALREAVLAACERSLPEDHPGLLAARANLAVSMFGTGDIAGARALAEVALAGYERSLPRDHPDLLTARGNLAEILHVMGDLAGARVLQEAVLVSVERSLPDDHASVLFARARLAITMFAMGDLAGARALLPALVSGMQNRVLASLTLAPREARQTVASETRRHSEAFWFTDSGNSDADRSVFELTETMRLVAVEAAHLLGRFGADPELAPILEEAAEVRRELNDLVAGAARDKAGTEAVAARLTALSLQRDRFEREASSRLAQRGIVTQPVRAVDLSVALATGEAAVGFRRVAHWETNGATRRLKPRAGHLVAYVLTSKGGLSRVDLGRVSELEELANEWRNALGAPLVRGLGVREEEGEDTELSAGRSLRARVLDPILNLLDGDVKRLFVCADDLIFLLPLDALPDAGDGNARLGDRLRIVNEVSFARLLSPSASTDGVPSLLAFGGVDYDAQGAGPEEVTLASAPIEVPHGGELAGATSRSSLPARFQKLLQARYEAQATADLFEEAFGVEPTLLTMKKTTKAALFEFAAGKRYLHLATHGWFAPESVRSTEDVRPAGESFARMGAQERVTGLAPMTLCGLALAGANKGRDSLGRVPGILTAEELCSLDLSQCELAVLSACETNVGIRRAGQGIQSLQSALYAAGARTSITSLWKVDDAATRRLMEVFYTNLWIEKMGKAEALWQAKQALRDEGHPPARWAGWVLTGDPE